VQGIAISLTTTPTLESGTFCREVQDCMELTWYKGKCSSQEKLDPRNNCGIIRIAPGYTEYSSNIAMLSTTSSTDTGSKELEVKPLR